MNRALHAAILLSLALHGVILLGPPLEREAAKLEAPHPAIAARLVEPPPPASPPAPPPPALVPPAPVKKPVPRPKPAPGPKPQRAVPAKPVPAPPAAPAIPSSPPPAPHAARPDPPAAVPAAPPAENAPAADEVTQAEWVERYRFLLREAAGRYKRYPENARDLQWTGEVSVRLAVGPQGRLADLRIERSSGYRILDRQALETLRRAHARVDLPPALRDEVFTLQVRVVYRLDQESR